VAKPLVFISCGQVNPKETELGKAIAKFISDETPYEPYFAENQNSLEGLITNIFGALDRCVALIAVMHHRGEVNTPSGTHTRASLWIEQEIAIASFIQHMLHRQIEVLLFIESGIRREGVREQLRLAPIEFERPEQVLEGIRERLRSWNLRGSKATIEGPLRECLNVIELAENALSQARNDVQNANVSTVFGEKQYLWRELQELSLDAAEKIRKTHFNVNRALLYLRQIAQPIPSILQQIAEGIASKQDRSKVRDAFNVQAAKLDEAITVARKEIERAVT